MNYQNLLGPDGNEDNMGGTTQRAFLASINDFLSIKTPVSNPTTFAEKCEIDGAHTFKTGKCFKKIYCTMDKGKLDLKSQGEIDGKSFKIEGEIFYPGSKSDAHGFAAQAKNDNFMLLIEHPDSEINGHLQVGTEKFPAKISPEFTTATNSSGVKGFTFKFEAMASILNVYKNTITLTPAS